MQYLIVERLKLLPYKNSVSNIFDDIITAKLHHIYVVVEHDMRNYCSCILKPAFKCLLKTNKIFIYFLFLAFVQLLSSINGNSNGLFFW